MHRKNDRSEIQNSDTVTVSQNTLRQYDHIAGRSLRVITDIIAQNDSRFQVAISAADIEMQI